MEAAWSISIWRFPGNGNSQSSLEARARVGELRGWISAIKNLPREIRTPSTSNFQKAASIRRSCSPRNKEAVSLYLELIKGGLDQRKCVT
ncbi:uncharacterized protein LOC125501113 isoform X2 [Athalia rosae]|uniref:uncharacterized protein LOC125501113 isoform X2 n=1 Tax=Athalia rosae TaxID=37344 RepID=UPI0020348E67|nr:uncharacterized protein LOC125501113 isoform X2 [Athalia rosae]